MGVDLTQLFIGIGGGAGFSALVAAFAGRGKQRADAAAVMTGATGATIAALRTELEAVQEDVRELRREVSEVSQQLYREQRTVASAARYIGALLRIIRDHAPDAQVPDPPDELRDLV